MKTKLIPIGNSKGIRIPKVLLKDSGIVKDVEITLTRKGLIISPIESSKSDDRENAKLSEKALAKDWNRPEEDKAWENL